MATLLLMLIGVLIRIKIYFQNRSLFIDEANLALNIKERSISQFFENLSYEQFAPPLFLVETKWITYLLGESEYALRLMPFIAGLGSLWLAWHLSHKWLSSDLSKFFFLGHLALSVLMLQYGTEFKQYSTDVFITLALLCLVSRDEASWRGKDVVFWSILGGICVWYSMPSTFLLAGIGFFHLFKQRRLSVSIPILIWLFSFGCYYFSILASDIKGDYLQSYFESSFFSLELTKEAMIQNAEILIGFFQALLDKTALSIAFGTILFFFGAYNLFVTARFKFIVLGIPVLATIIASCLHYYVFITRTTLFLQPIVLLIIAFGIDYLMRKLPKWGYYLAVILVIIGLYNKKGHLYLFKEMTFEEIRPCIAYLKNNVGDDFLYVDHEAVPAFRYYWDNHSDLVSNVHLGTWDSDISEVSQSNNHKDFWVLFSHTAEDIVLQKLESISHNALPEVKCQSPNVSLYHIK